MSEQGLRQEELEEQAAEPLPDREAMSIVDLGDGFGVPPPIDEEPVYTTPGGPADGPMPPPPERMDPPPEEAA